MPTLYEIRISKDLTQTQVAQMAGVSMATVNRMENGHPIQRGNVLLICQALGVSPQEVTDVRVYSAVQAAAKRKKAKHP